MSTKQPEIKKAMEIEAGRAKSIWHEESNQIATVLNQAHQLDRSRSAQEINKHLSDGINKDREKSKKRKTSANQKLRW